MEHQGYSQYQKGRIDDLLAGPTGSPPAGYKTLCGFYSLKGGIHAQETFHQECVKLARQKLGLVLDGINSASLEIPGYRVLTQEETKHWRPHSSLTEYEKISPITSRISEHSPTPLRTISSSSPPPSSPLHLLCQCGIESDGHRELVRQETVECHHCHKWSHLACLVNRSAPTIEGDFICHLCKPTLLQAVSENETFISNMNPGIQMRCDVLERL
jgi:hypothetical protein